MNTEHKRLILKSLQMLIKESQIQLLNCSYEESMNINYRIIQLLSNLIESEQDSKENLLIYNRCLLNVWKWTASAINNVRSYSLNIDTITLNNLYKRRRAKAKMVNKCSQTDRINFNEDNEDLAEDEKEFMAAYNRSSSFANSNIKFTARIPSESSYLHFIETTKRTNENNQSIFLVNSLKKKLVVKTRNTLITKSNSK